MAGSYKEDIAAAMGALIVLFLVCSLALTIAYSPKWFADFLMGTASGWFQGIGAIAAIVGAAYFPWRAGQDQHRLAVEQAKSMSFNFGGAVWAAAAGFAQSQHVLRIVAVRATLVDALNAVQGISIGLLPMERQVALAALRSTAAQMVELTKGPAEGRSFDATVLQQILATYEPNVEHMCDVLSGRRTLRDKPRAVAEGHAQAT